MDFPICCYDQELERLVEDSTRFAPKEVPFAVETLARLQKEPLPAAAASDKERAASVPQAVDDASGSQVLDLEILSPTTTSK